MVQNSVTYFMDGHCMYRQRRLLYVLDQQRRDNVLK